MWVEKTRYEKVLWNWWASVVIMLYRTGWCRLAQSTTFSVWEVVGATFSGLSARGV